MEKIKRIEVMADSMRVGKTTAVQVIAEGLRGRGYQVVESFEDWEHNPYLKESYSDPAKNFLESQKWFIKRKHEQIRQAHCGQIGQAHCEQIWQAHKNIFIQDVAPEMDYAYAETNRRLTRMSDEHFGQYDEFYHSLPWEQAPAPDLLVYLQVSDDELLRRAMDSRREFETVDPSYFLMMKKVNREWLVDLEKNGGRANGRGRHKVLKIDTDQLDFAHDEGAKAELVSQVVQIGML